MVTAFLFSGRPNPEWLLTEWQQKNWMQLWQQAPLSNTEVKQPSALGYSGCRLYHNEHSYWQAYNGCVSFFEDGKVFSKEDDKEQLEQFLLNTAPEQIKLILQEQGIIQVK